VKQTETLRPLHEFLSANGLELRHLKALAAAGFPIPIVEIDGDRFVPRDEAQELIGRVKIRAMIAATSGDGLKIAEVR
jgi:hypothetical protein